MKWTDVYEIAIALADRYPEINPQYVNFVDLRNWVIDLPQFADDVSHCGEKILEAIQSAWIEEVD